MEYTDQLGNTIQLNAPPQRIVSLVPSQTELLFDLGLAEQVVGVTRFCIHPPEAGDKEKIGGTKRFNIEKIQALQPDLLIGNKEENYEEGITELQKHYPVWMSDIYTLADNYRMMQQVAHITGTDKTGERLIQEIQQGFAAWQPVAEPKRVAYFIWRKPYMVAAGNTFINHLLGVFGLTNVFAHQTRYPEIQPGDLAALKPDLIFLSSEPYSFSEKHFEEFREFYPGAKVMLVDGEMFSWYGSRLRYVPAYFEKLKEEI